MQPGMPPASVSFVTPLGYQAGSCGYCKDAHSGQRSPNSTSSFYLLAKALSVDHYQDLVDRGWRRSGTLLYKPDLRRQCCPHYTIRLPVADFHPSKDQRQAINRWNKFVLGDDYSAASARLYPKSKEEKNRRRNSFSLLDAVHEADQDRLRTPPEPAHRFQVTLGPDTFTEEKYRLFEDYQQTVHHEGPDDVSQKGFKRFLCSSPLERVTRTTSDGVEQKLGSFHQCYRLDGRLIAIGVLDLLPHCVSGVYFMYHADFEKWSFGKISALQEAALALEFGHQYYYMGYYIQSCVKMRYKADYKPQYLLDLETGAWDPLDAEMKRLLSKKKYVSMSKERTATTDMEVPSEEMDVDKPDQPPSALHDPYEAATAYEAGVSLFDLKLPGIMTPDEIEDKVELDQMLVRLNGGKITYMANLVSWEAGSVTNPHSLKGLVAETVACVGPDVAGGLVISLGS